MFTFIIELLLSFTDQYLPLKISAEECGLPIFDQNLRVRLKLSYVYVTLASCQVLFSFILSVLFDNSRFDCFGYKKCFCQSLHILKMFKCSQWTLSESFTIHSRHSKSKFSYFFKFSNGNSRTNVWNLFKVGNKDTRTVSSFCSLSY